ncbi:ABC transporter permease [Enterococcus faecalis]|uniref:ABC transporter permease n=1 Tax=Enterococcus faecalis TaxID=1351 RepID=UPI0032E041C3
MNTWLIALSSIKQRIRRFSFWAIAAVALTSSFLLVPKNQIGGMHVMSIEPSVFLQAGNPTWIPIAAALVLTIFLPLIGFVYIRDLVNIDRNTRTMDILLSSGVGRFRYVFGKLIAGFILLLLLLGIVMCGSLITILITFHGESISIWTFISPFLALVPGLLFISAFSLILETASIFGRVNSSALGIFLFVLFFLVSLTYSMSLAEGNPYSSANFDFTGLLLLEKTINIAVIATIGKSVNDMTIFGSNNYSYIGNKQLYFTGIPKDINVFFNMFFVIGLALLITFIAALLLEKRPAKVTQKKKIKFRKQVKGQVKPTTETWQPVSNGSFSLFFLIRSELHRLLRELNLWWFITILGLWIGCCLFEIRTSRTILLPIILGLTVLPLSRLGSGEELSGMGKMLRTIPGAPLRQALTSISGGMLLCLFLISPVFIRSFSIDLVAVLVIFSLGICLPSVASFLGTFTKTERPFQLTLFLFLYIVLNLPDLLLPTDGDSAIAIVVSYFIVAGISIIGVIGLKEKQMR